jgi:hypothetical protein
VRAIARTARGLAVRSGALMEARRRVAGPRRGGTRPTLGGRGRGACGGRFMAQAPDDGGAADDIARAPSSCRWHACGVTGGSGAARSQGPGERGGLCAGRVRVCGGTARATQGRARPWVGAGGAPVVGGLWSSPGRRRGGGRHRQSALPGGGSGAARAGRPGQGANAPAASRSRPAARRAPPSSGRWP